MSRLIDADVFIGNIVSIADLRTISTKTIGEALDKTPTVDVVPVVRCKDCKWYQPDADKWCGYFECMGFEPDDYCSQGVKDGERHG